VHKGEVLAVLSGTAAYEDVTTLEQAIEGFLQNDNFPKALLTKKLQLGELQGNFSQFVLDYTANGFQSSHRFAETNISQIKQQITNLQLSIGELAKIQSVTANEAQLARRQFLDKQSLYSSGAIDRFELESFKSKEYQKDKELKHKSLRSHRTKPPPIKHCPPV
jgi:hypothetical protein